MDVSKMSQGQMAAGVGGVLLLISLFLDWVSGITITNPVTGGSISGGGGSAFDVFSGMDIIMLIVAVIAILWAVGTAVGSTVNVPSYAPLVVGMLGVAMFGFTLGYVLENSNAGIGAWLGLVAAIALAWGGVEGSRRPAAAARTTTAPSTPPGPPPSTPAV